MPPLCEDDYFNEERKSNSNTKPRPTPVIPWVLSAYCAPEHPL